MDNNVALGDDAPVVDESKQYNATAMYRYPIKRLLEPSVLANDYVSIKKCFLPTHELDAHEQFNVYTSNVNANQLWKYEPTFTAANIIGSGTLSAYLFGVFDEFRIRAVRVQFNSSHYMDLDSHHVDHFIWFVENHQEYDNESGTEFTTYRQLETFKGNGARIIKLGSRPDAGFAMNWIPQVPSVQDNVIGNDAVFADMQCPWLTTSDSNKDLVMRGPVFIWRRPYIARDPAKPNDDFVAATYNVNYTAVIEFRNMDSNKL